MAVRVAINGFGRIGRATFRAAVESGADVEIVAVNDVVDAELLAHLLRHDTIYGPFPGEVEAAPHGLLVDGREVAVPAVTDPAWLPWQELGVDVVLECTGKFRKRLDAQKHLNAGAKKVVISAPATEPDATFVIGVNDHTYEPEHHAIISNASCTTNCLAPVAKVLHEGVGIKHGVMTTVHSYTGDQPTLDTLHKDLYRGRAAAMSQIPTSTGAAKAIGLVIPELEGKLKGYAVRVPVITGSMVDLTVEVERPTTAEEINALFREHADTGPLEGILKYTEEPLVSSDVIKSNYSSIFDSQLTIVVNDTQVKLVSWYDNEWGYSARLIELAAMVGAPLALAV